jgi:hypothetical protein
MGDKSKAPSPLDAMERERERFLSEAADYAKKSVEATDKAASIASDIAAYIRITSSYTAAGAAPVGTAPKSPSASVTSLSGLIKLYKTHERSPYKALRFASRKHYEHLLDRLDRDHGTIKLSELTTASVIEDLHKGWTESGSHMAHRLITMVRGLISFGIFSLDDEQCKLIGMILHKMRFELPKKSESLQLTREQAELIIEKSKELGRPSVGLAQAFQIDVPGLRQIDVVGEWVPISEAGMSGILNGKKQKWLRGLRWEEIDSEFVLRHPSSFSGKVIEASLRDGPLVMREMNREIARLGGKPTKGPVVISEHTKLPWDAGEYRRWWRQLADACGLPKNVKNMDSRPTRDTKQNEQQKDKRPVTAEVQSTGR